MSATTPPELVTQWLADGSAPLKQVILTAVPAIIGLGAFFWAGRLVLSKLGMAGPVATLSERPREEWQIEEDRYYERELRMNEERYR